METYYLNGIKITYDNDLDVAYIYLIDQISARSAAGTISCDLAILYEDFDINDAKGHVNIDFDDRGHMLGIEILVASSVLPHSILSIIQKRITP